MKSCFDCKYNCTAESFEDCTSKGLLFFKPIKKENRVSEERSCNTCGWQQDDECNHGVGCEDFTVMEQWKPKANETECNRSCMRYSECLAHGWKGEASGCEYHKPDRFPDKAAELAYAEATTDQPEQLTSVDRRIPPIEEIREEFKDTLENPDVRAVAEGNWGNLEEPKVKSDGSTASYYELPEGATELQDLISHLNLNAQIGEIFRACYRYGRVAHSEMLRDAKKIKFYAEAEIKRLEKLKEN